MQSTYDEALRRLLVHEGGYSNHPSDPGGPTNFGITLADYRRYIKPGASAADVRNMTVGEAKLIYAKQYAAPLRYDDLPAGVDDAVFDYGVNSGISRAAKVLQRICGVTDDGKIGPLTLAAVAKRDPRDLINAICDERMRFLKSLRTWSVFGKGWATRVYEVRSVALVMAGHANVAPVPTPYLPGKGKVTAPSTGTIGTVSGGGLAGMGLTVRDWVLTHPFEAAAIGLVVIGVVVIAINAWHRITFDSRQDAPTPDLVPVPEAA